MTSKDGIEKEVIDFFGALLNGHHNSDLINTGASFVPDNTFLAEFLEGLSSMDNGESEKLHEDIDIDEIDVIVKACENNQSTRARWIVI